MRTPPYCFICGHIYDETIIEASQSLAFQAICAQMGRVLLQRPDSKIFVICADDHFESKFGARADKKRKLYNGSIRTTYYQYYKKR